MKLYIDTSDRKKIVVGLDNKKFETDTKDATSQKLLPFIDEVLKKNKKTIKDITEIKVAAGPGSFTGLRVGASIAQTLGFALNIPVNGRDVLRHPVEIKY